MYRRNLQKIYVEKLISLVNPPPPAAGNPYNPYAAAPGTGKISDVLSIVKGHTRSLAAEIKMAIPSVRDQATRLHLQDVWERLNATLNPK